MRTFAFVALAAGLATAPISRFGFNNNGVFLYLYSRRLELK